MSGPIMGSSVYMKDGFIKDRWKVETPLWVNDLKRQVVFHDAPGNLKMTEEIAAFMNQFPISDCMPVMSVIHNVYHCTEEVAFLTQLTLTEHVVKVWKREDDIPEEDLL